MVQNITDANFEQEVLKAEGLVVVDFFAEWCGPCKAMAPSVDKLAKEFEGRAKVGKIDVDANSDTGGRYEIQSIPTVIYFKNGEIVGREVGFKGEDAMRQKFEALA